MTTTECLEKVYIARDAGRGYTLSRLDRFAMAALTGLLANPRVNLQAEEDLIGSTYDLAEKMLIESRRRNNPS